MLVLKNTRKPALVLRVEKFAFDTTLLPNIVPFRNIEVYFKDIKMSSHKKIDFFEKCHFYDRCKNETFQNCLRAAVVSVGETAFCQN